MTLDRQPGRAAGHRAGVEERRDSGATTEIAAANARIAELEIRLLASRDFAVGAEAETARLREQRDAANARSRQLRERFRKARTERNQLRTQVRELELEIESIRASETWRVGRVVVRPFALLRRRPRT